MKILKHISIWGTAFLFLFLIQEAKAQESMVHIEFAEGAPIEIKGPDGFPNSVYFNIRVNPIEEVAHFIITESSDKQEEGVVGKEIARIPIIRKGNEFYLDNGLLIFQGFIKYTMVIPPYEKGSTMGYSLYVEDHQGLVSKKLPFRVQ